MRASSIARSGRRQWNAWRRGVVKVFRLPWVRRILWGTTLTVARRRGRHCRPMVASHQRSDRTRYGDAVVESGDREEFRRQADRRGRRHPDRARRERPHILALARHRRARRRRHRGGERAESRSGPFRLGPADRQCARGKPQSGRRRNVGADRDRRPGHRVRRRQQAADRHRVRQVACGAAWPARPGPRRRDRCAPARRTLSAFSPGSTVWARPGSMATICASSVSRTAI